MFHELDEFRQLAEELARQAGEQSKAFFRRASAFETKADGSIVTEADQSLEQFMRKQIRERYPEHRILGEEYGEDGPAEARYRWILDPIDGTWAFARGIPLYAVLIALEVEGELQVGVSYFPMLDQLLSAAKGQGATLNGEPIHVSQRSDAASSLALFSKSEQPLMNGHIGDRWQRVKARFPHTAGFDGSYVAFLVAVGQAEFGSFFGRELWDYAPYAVIIQEAGGLLANWERGKDVALPHVVMTTPTVMDILKKDGVF